MATGAPLGCAAEALRCLTAFRHIEPCKLSVPGHDFGVDFGPDGSTLDVETAMETAGSEEDLETGNIVKMQEVWHMYRKLHAVYGVWIVQREGLR